MSDEDIRGLHSSTSQSKWASIITAVLVAIKTIIDIVF